MKVERVLEMGRKKRRDMWVGAATWCCLLAGLAGLPTGSAAEPTIGPANRALLQSESWRQIMHQFDEWASVQKIYDKDQVAKYRQQLIQKASTLPPQDLESFVEDLAEKLEILTGAEARAARRWLTDTLSNASDSYAKKVRSQLPDVASLSAGQLADELQEFQTQRNAAKKTNDEFAAMRAAEVKAATAQRQREEAANARAETMSSGYHPGYGYGGYSNAGGYRGGGGYGLGRGWGGFRW